MIRVCNGETVSFVLDTRHTTYVFGMNAVGQPVHDYYGKKIRVHDVQALREKHAFAPGNSLLYNQDHPEFSPEDTCMECSTYGKGDIGEPMVEVLHEDGSSTLDFVYDSYTLSKGRGESEVLPGSYDPEEKADHLCVVFKERSYGETLRLHYAVYEDCDVITRWCELENTSGTRLIVNRLLSMQTGFYEAGKKVSFFHGAWAREMNREDHLLNGGKLVSATLAGTSSNRANPFFMAADPDCGEDHGNCCGFNLIYSGCHYEALEVNSYGKTRIVSGLNPQGFRWVLEPGECLEAPEAVLSFSHEGYNGLSAHMHAFVREHIVRGTWKDKERPVLLNSWEASYFDFTGRSLLKLAKSAKELGVELFVMDDGWFGKRNDDHAGLGDWDVNTAKLPGGVKGLAEKVNALGMLFGIWVEPEMVNVDSDLYRAHPDWTLEIPGKPHSEGRNQRILDLCNPEVVDWMIEKMSEVFRSGNIAYVKWDMNRIFSDVYSPYLDSAHQGEVFHRYVLGLYKVMKELVKRFPDILFEGCSSGGNRFDLGILCYFPQIWASDNTDAISRLDIQQGYSYGYPQSTMGAHVSAVPNHQTLRVTPMETRFHVAMCGLLGYECNLNDLSPDDRQAIGEQIALYKQYRKTLQFGQFYRGTCPEGEYAWTIVSPDQKQALGMCAHKLVKANYGYLEYHAHGLKEDVLYHFSGETLKHSILPFGDLINQVAPVHVKQDSLAHHAIAKFVKMDGECEDVHAFGDTLMYAGVKLHPGFAGTGYNDQVRFYPDFASRIYFMEEEEGNEPQETASSASEVC